jgi:hypothetical protein
MRQIWSRSQFEKGWRPYAGENPHDHHCHISIDAQQRADASPWPWAPA